MFAPTPLLGVVVNAEEAHSRDGIANETAANIAASALAAAAISAAAQLPPFIASRRLEDRIEADKLAMDAQAAFDTGVACNPELPHHPQCEAGTKCRYFSRAPWDGLMSFDNIGDACIVILQAITFDTWTEAMYALMAAFSPYACIFFVLIVVLGGFFVINLFLAVIFQEVLAAQAMEKAKEDMNERQELLSPRSSQRAAEEAEQPAAALAASSTSTVPDLEGGLPGAETGADTVALLNPAGTSSSGALSSRRGACDCVPRPGSWRAKLGQTVTAEWFGNLSTLVVLLNMALMCMPYEGMSDAYAARLEGLASMISWMFIVEMALKLLGLGCKAYWADGWNQLDGTIVIMSVVEMVLTAIFEGGGIKLSFLRILRMLRVVRVLRLMKSWKGLYKIILTFGKALPQMGNIFVLMSLILVIFALLGMQILGGQYNPSTGFSDVPCPGGVCPDDALEEKPRYHFDYFGPAITTCFIVMTGTWIDPLAPAVAVGGQKMVLYFVLLVLVGCYIIMNLFVAILVNAFADDEDDPPPSRRNSAEGPISPRSIAALRSPRGQGSPRGLRSPRGSTVAPQAADTKSPVSRAWPHDYSLYLFGPRDRVRVCCQRLVEHDRFDQFIILAILASSLCLAFDVPRLDQSTELAAVLRTLNSVWTTLFFTEFLLKIIAYGFACTETAYINSPWNLLDLAIVAVSFLVLLAEVFPPFAGLKALRVLRVLRPLRLLSRNEGMRLIITSLIKTLPAVSNVLGVVLAFQLVFAILGMQVTALYALHAKDPRASQSLPNPKQTLVCIAALAADALLLLRVRPSRLLCSFSHAAIHGRARLMHRPCYTHARAVPPTTVAADPRPRHRARGCAEHPRTAVPFLLV